MPVKINGLPAHVLLIHVVVVFVPLAALMLVAGAVWPAARAKLGFLTPASALVALIFVPITTHAGKWLQDHLPSNIGHTNPQIVRHAHLGGELLPWVVGIFVMSVVVWLLGLRYELTWRPRPEQAAIDTATEISAGGTATLERTQRAAPRTALPVWLTAVVAVVAIGVSVGGVVQLVRIGDAGAKAAWSGSTTG